MRNAQLDHALVSIAGVSKAYPGVQALSNVDLELRAGRIIGLAGENGAGKSTLIKVLAGAVQPDSGRVEIGGQALPSSTGGVIDAGISVIYQELTDIPFMSVAENLTLGRQVSRLGIVDRRAVRATARAALDQVGLSGLDLSRPIGSLSIAQRQLLEIARCLVRDARVLVFDEPTSALPEADVDNLMDVIKRLREAGLAILYVSHHLDEFFRIADDVVVMRDGKVVAHQPLDRWTNESLVKAMLAKDLQHAYPWRSRPVGDVALTATDLVAPNVRSSSVELRSGEIVGLVGLAGAGRTELMKALAGAVRRRSGVIEVAGSPLRSAGVPASRDAGIFYVPEDRKHEGLFLENSIIDNVVVGNYPAVSVGGWIRRDRAAALARGVIDAFGVRVRSARTLVGKLSGGNQQKVVLGRVGRGDPSVVLLDDPTRGIDVGSKAAIYENVLRMAEDGIAVLLASSDTDEVLAMSDRCYVLRQGRIVAEVVRSDFDRESILHLAAAGSSKHSKQQGDLP